MKKIILFFGLQLLLFQALLAQTSQSIIPNWEVGDELTVFETGKGVKAAFGLEEHIVPVNEFKIVVISKNEDDYLLEVSNYTIYDITDGGIISPFSSSFLDRLEPVLSKAKAMKLLVRVSKEGQITDLENWEEVQAMCQEVITAYINTMHEYFDDQEEGLDSSFLQHSLQQVSTKEKVMKKTLKPLEYIFSGYNIEFSKHSLTTSAQISG